MVQTHKRKKSVRTKMASNWIVTSGTILLKNRDEHIHLNTMLSSLKDTLKLKQSVRELVVCLKPQGVPSSWLVDKSLSRSTWPWKQHSTDSASRRWAWWDKDKICQQHKRQWYGWTISFCAWSSTSPLDSNLKKCYAQVKFWSFFFLLKSKILYERGVNLSKNFSKESVIPIMKILFYVFVMMCQYCTIGEVKFISGVSTIILYSRAF